MQNILYKKSQHKLFRVFDNAFVTSSKASIDILKQVRAVAQSDCSLMIYGESGTGKELIANYCHRSSLRKGAPFVAVNCAALPDDLLESELFGHKKGAFTGAISENEGLIKKANCGTLFLDEIGDMSLKTQAKLLRVLQEKTVRPVGGGQEESVDFRVICATHKNLLNATETGDFRADLYFRLSVVPIYIPPLRCRTDDILPIAQHLINRIAVKAQKPPKKLSGNAEVRLLQHNWAGNVRELYNVIERAIVFSENMVIESDSIRFDSDFLINNICSSSKKIEHESLDLKEMEKLTIKAALDKTNGIKSKAARLLGIDRKTLFRKEKEYFI